MQFFVVVKFHAICKCTKHIDLGPLTTRSSIANKKQCNATPYQGIIKRQESEICSCYQCEMFQNVVKCFSLGEWLVFKSDGSARCENKKYCFP